MPFFHRRGLKRKVLVSGKDRLSHQARALAKVSEQSEIIRATHPRRGRQHCSMRKMILHSMPTKLSLKKPEVVIVSQKSLEVLEYYAQPTELLTEMELSDGELKMLFKSGFQQRDTSFHWGDCKGCDCSSNLILLGVTFDILI